jgi:hypothetical protein
MKYININSIGKIKKKSQIDKPFNFHPNSFKMPVYFEKNGLLFVDILRRFLFFLGHTPMLQE